MLLRFVLLCTVWVTSAQLILNVNQFLKHLGNVENEEETEVLNSEEEPLNLTPLIASAEWDKARRISAVDPDLFAGVKSHAAYFSVNETFKWNMFFWYFPAEDKPLNSTPLIIWLNGGPGVTSLYGLFEEIGPIRIENGKAVKMDISWASDYSLLFIDNPVGTGFSYTESDQYATNEDMVGAGLLSLLQQFLQVFPELRSAPLFIAGESYAGKYIPAFGHYILHNRDTNNPINLKGLAIGNGWIDPPNMLHLGEFGRQTGLLSSEIADQVTKNEDRAREEYNQNHDHDVLKKGFLISLSKFESESGVNIYNYMQEKKQSELETKFISFLNQAEVRKALHVGGRKTAISSNNVSINLADDVYLSMNPWLEELLERYPVMCYSGQLDVIVAYPMSVHGYRNLTWSGREQYLKAERKQILSPDKLVYGYMKEAGNFLEVMVRGAGHMVPTDRPRAAKFVLDLFVRKSI